MKQRKKSFGMRISAFVLSFAMVCTLLAGVNVVAFAADDNDLVVSVHSFYNDATKGGDGEHLYTKDLDEMSWLSSLPTWNDEDEAWKAPVSSSLAVYRVYNPNSGEHHYAAADEAEWLVSQGWTQEKIAFYSDDNMGVPIYRLWNGGEGVGSHYYTTDEGEAAYLASIGWTAEGVNFYGVKEEGEKEMTAAQTGADEITLTFSEPITGAETFEVSHGFIDDVVIDADYSEDMTMVVLTLDSNIEEEEYEVVCSDLEYEPATFVGEEAEVTYFKFASDKLIATDTSMTSAKVGFATLDQWGEYIVDESIADNPADAFIVAGAEIGNVVYIDEDLAEFGTPGTGSLTVNSTVLPFTVGSQVTATVVYAGETKMEQATFTVESTSVVSNMMVLDVTLNPLNDNYEDLEGKRITAARFGVDTLDPINGTAYLLPVIATDQYGNKLKAAELENMLDNSLYITPSAVNPFAVENKTVVALSTEMVDNPEVEGVVLIPVMGDGLNSGTGVINFLSTSGFTTSKSIVVEKNEMIDKLNVSLPDLQVGYPTPVAITAKNQYGEDVDLTSDKSIYTIEPTADEDGNDTILTITGADPLDVSTIETRGAVFVKNPTTGVITLTAQEGQEVEVITVKSATNKVEVLQKKVNEAAVPKTIKGLVDGIDTTLVGGTNDSITISRNDVVILDQYGKEYKGALPDGYDITVTAASAAKTAVTGTTISVKEIPITGGYYTGPAKETYKVNLTKQGSVINNKQFTVTLTGEAKSYVAKITNVHTTAEKPNLYVGEESENDGDMAILKVYGVDEKGNEFLVNDGYTASLQNNKVAGATLALTGSTITVETANDSMTTSTAKAYVDVYDNNTGKIIATAEISCSNEAPTPFVFLCFDGAFNPVDYSEGLDLTNDNYTAILSDEDVVNGGMVMLVPDDPTANPTYMIAAMDQYGMISANYCTYNGEELEMAGTEIVEDGILVIASSELSVKILVKAE